MKRGMIATALAALALAGCGGGSETAPQGFSTEASSGNDSGYVAKADRICVEMTAAARSMGTRFRQIPRVEVDALTLTTRRLVKPAIPILEASSRRLRALGSRTASVKFDSYTALFDPLVSLARERARAGEAGDSDRAHTLELLLLELSGLQRRIAREAGLETCDVDFIQIFSFPGGAR
jgi:hypothetical protein